MGLGERFTRRFGLTAPIALAPMAGAAGGALAGAVARAGGLGLLGGGYGDGAWIAAQWAKAEGVPIGIGFITWKLERAVLEAALARKPKAVMLSFGDPRPFAPLIAEAGVPLLCQCQSLEHAHIALEAGAEVLIAQGGEAGGHGDRRGTMTLVPEIADLLAARAPQTLLLAAGGIADGRGLAASVMLGADGVLMGSRFWAAAEALVAPGFHHAALAAGGDATRRSSVPDAARELQWPKPFTIRTLETPFISDWAERVDALRAPEALGERAAWAAAQAAGDAERGSPIIGEAVGLISDVRPAGEILARVLREAEAVVSGAKGRGCVSPRPNEVAGADARGRARAGSIEGEDRCFAKS